MIVRPQESIARLLGVVVAVFAASASGLAQQPATRAGSTIAGVVYDSLVKNAPLTGAEVTVDGTALSALTDSHGQFRLEGVPPGRVVVRFYHAMLDSLGFGAPPVAMTVPDSGGVSVRLATPSPKRFRASLCPGPQPQSTGVVLGRVRDVDDHAPLPGATATVSWTEWLIGKDGMTRADRRATADANVAGAFALCGVPNDVAVVVRADANGHVTGLIEVDLAHALFAVRDFSVSVKDSGSSVAELARLDSAIQRGDSTKLRGGSSVVGIVRADNGKLVDHARVAVLGLPTATVASSDGAYALLDLPAGTQTLDVRAIGYGQTRLTLDLGTGQRRTVDITLEAVKAQELAPVTILGRGTHVDRTGFEDRHKAGIGQFITEEEIARRGVFDTEQALWNVLGARVVWDGYENVVRFTRPAGSGRSGGTFSTLCAPAFWVDGIPMARPVPGFPEDVHTFVKPRDIRGIEVYTSPSQAPPQYRRPDVECGVVMIWTKAPRPKQLKQPSR
jgi:hypothetical protein